MNDDRELLELAAKAAELIGYINEWINGPEFIIPGENPVTWNPLTNDGDALRLAVKLDLLGCARFTHERDVLMFTKGMDKFTATRRAIVRAAAEIGKSMP